MDTENEVVREGWLRKKGSRVNMWSDRYFVLRGPSLFYFLKSSDVEPKGLFILQSGCKISEIRSDISKKRKQFLFRVTWPVDEELEETPPVTESYNAEANKRKKKFSSQPSSRDDKTLGLSAGKIAALAVGGVVVGALTAGVGLVAGMVVLGIGAAAGGGAAAVNQGKHEAKEKFLTLASDTYGEAERWTHAIADQIARLRENDGAFSPDRLKIVSRNAPPPEVRLEEVEKWLRWSKWRISVIIDGFRIFEQIDDDAVPSGARNDIMSLANSMIQSQLSSRKSINNMPCLRTNITMHASPADVFMTLMNMPPGCRTGVVRSLRIVESMDNQTDIVHLTLDPMYIYPTWTAPRDLVLIRYWKHNSDGSYVICVDSAEHRDCPLVPGYVRGLLHGVYLISPPKNDEDQTECLLTFIAQYDPRGWIWQTGGYQISMLHQLMLHVVDIRDTINADRFLQVHFDAATERSMVSANKGAPTSSGAKETLANTPPSTLSTEMWGEPDPSTFRVRGKTYNQDKVKTPSTTALFKLVALDLFEVPEPTRNISSHPRNRVHLAKQRGDDVWVFVVNIMVPGPPYLSFVAYFQGDKSLLEGDTPFARIAHPFFFGNDDEFRNNRFKLIPKVVDGNMIVKMAVKDTPTLLGNKLKQYYYKGDNYFELDVDVGSSSVARHVVGIAIGYSKAIIVDMGFCLQGNEENELPEVLMGACTCIHLDTTTAKPL